MAASKNQVTKDFSIMGSTFINGASSLINRLRSKQRLDLKREPENPADTNAVLVLWGNRRLGWVPRGVAAEIAPLMDRGIKVIARKAPTALYGVCQLAYIQPPIQPPKQPPEWLAEKGLTQKDLDEAEDSPPIGDSRPPKDENNGESDTDSNPAA